MDAKENYEKFNEVLKQIDDLVSNRRADAPAVRYATTSEVRAAFQSDLGEVLSNEQLETYLESITDAAIFFRSSRSNFANPCRTSSGMSNRVTLNPARSASPM